MIQTLIVLLGSTLSAADKGDAPAGLLQQLPDGNAWATYLLDGNTIQNGEKTVRTPATYTIRSLGTETRNGKRCRWIEFEMKTRAKDGKARVWITKFLATEASLKRRRKPSIEVLAAKSKSPTGKIDKFSKAAMRSPAGNLSLLIAGGVAKPKTLAETTSVKYQKGTIKSTHGSTGTVNYAGDDTVPAELAARMVVTQHVWTNRKIPFGTVVLKLKVTYDAPKRIELFTVTLQDFGTAAKSKLR